MRNMIFAVFKILIAIVLFSKVLGLILNFSPEINQIINVTMFILIGISYLVAGYIWDNKIYKAIFIMCGLYLIIMNFFQNIVVLDILGIICILTPLILSYPGKKKERNISIS
jgi:hypothetical protein